MAVVFPRASERDARVDALRVPPHSIEAEQAVLGGLMLSAEAWDKVADRLVEEDFYRRDHQLIFRAIGQLAGQSQPCDAITLGEWFEAQGLAEQVGGSAYVIELASTTPSAANIMAYADIVREKSILRNLIDVGTQIVNDAFQPAGRDSREVLEDALENFEGTILSVSHDRYFINRFANRVLVLNVYRSISREQVEQYLYKMLDPLLRMFVERENIPVQEEDKQFIIDFYKYGFVGMVLEWIRRDMKTEPAIMAERLNIMMHGDLKRALMRFSTDGRASKTDD